MRELTMLNEAGVPDKYRRGADTRLRVLSSDRRKEISKLATDARWGRAPKKIRIEKPNPRDEARSAGLLRYSTGQPCRNGHLAERLTSTGKCVECHRLRRIRKYRANLESERRKKRAYDEKNRGIINGRARAAREKNPNPSRQSMRRWRLKNLEKARADWRDYYRKNAERERLRSQIKRAHRATAEGYFTEDDLIRIFEQQCGKCAMCRISLKKVVRHLDHIIAIMLIRLSPNGARC